MEVHKTYLFIDGHDDGSPFLMDTIWHEGHWWLVTSWLEHQVTRHRIPERIIQLDGTTVRFQEVMNQPYRFFLNNALPKSVLDGTPQIGYVAAIHPLAISDSQGPKSIH